jgi:hypothetical protein
MTAIVAQFKALSLAVQLQAYPEITAVPNAAKDARCLQLEAEIRGLGFTPGKGKRKSDRPVKYRGPDAEVWSGTGAMVSWLRKLKDVGQDVEAYRI